MELFERGLEGMPIDATEGAAPVEGAAPYAKTSLADGPAEREPDLQALGRMAHRRIRLVRKREENGKKNLRLGVSAEMRRWPDQYEGNDRECLFSSSPSDPCRSTIYPMVEIRFRAGCPGVDAGVAG